MNSNIYQIEQEYLEIMNLLEEAEGELTPELSERLLINEKDRDRKIGAYIAVIKQKNADIALAQDEIKRYNQIIEREEKIIKRLKNTILAALELFELRGKSGNVSHKVDGHSMFGRDFSSVVEANPGGLPFDGEELYADYLNFTINTKFSNKQIDMIRKLFSEEDENYTIIDAKHSIKKNEFKEAIEDAANIPDDDEREEREEFLHGLGTVDTHTTLIIRGVK